MDLFVAQPPVNYSLSLKPLDYKKNCFYATVIKRLLEVPQPRINAALLRPFNLFKFHTDGKVF